MHELDIDIETFSDVDISKAGVYRYSESEAFEVLLFAYAVDSGPVQVVDVASGESIPRDILEALTDNSVLKWAHNCAFERVCLSSWLRRRHPAFFSSYGSPADTVGDYLDPAAWRCSMIWASYLGLPRSLKGVGAVLNLADQKMAEGTDLVRYFCVPCRPTIKNGGRTRNLPSHDPEKWATFKAYNVRDVEVELAVKERLTHFPVPDFLWDEFILDQQINDRGVALDLTLVEQAISMDARSHEELTKAMKELTELENPNSVSQMKQWLTGQGLEMESLGKKEVAEVLKTAPHELGKVLQLRQQLARSSVKKYQAMQNAVCADGRARGAFQFYGASRTGRWAGRLIQLQNLPQNRLPDLEQARSLVHAGDFDAVEMCYEDVPDTLSQLVRTAFVPKPGCRFLVADFSAIEARVLAWLAGEKWRQEVFASGGDIYCASASQMFKVPVEKHGINGHLRQKGKIAELALGYGGSVGALKAMGALDLGLSEDELQPLVNMWRSANPNITKFWKEVDRAAMTAVREHTDCIVSGIRFSCQSGMLFIILPSERKLAYVKPRIGTNQFGNDCITFEGTGSTKKWERMESYGPRFVENIVQATSRDILCYAMKNLRHCFITMHIHDELVIEADTGITLESVCERMGRTPPWAAGLQLRADGYETPFYKKD